MSWLLDWLLRTAQDFLKNGLSLNNALLFTGLIIFAGLILKGKSAVEFILNAYNNITNRNRIKELEDSIKNLRLEIYSKLNYLGYRDQEFKRRVELITKQIKDLLIENKIDGFTENKLANDVKNLENLHEESFQEIKELVDSIYDELTDAERVLADAESGEWTRKNAGEIFKKFYPSSSSQKSIRH